ncbi:MAG: hypothetical protein KKE05_05400 [Nanoarchaeota archaeon]|nr:hypothetical protein [Nanoarchaeota archaeon]
MSQKNLWVFIVSVFALAFAMGSVSAFGNIETVEVNGVLVVDHGQQVGSVDLANFVGDRVPVLVVFKANNGTGVLAEDVRIKAWISGEAENVVTSERFDVLPDRTYTRIVYLDIPSDLRDKLDETRKLEILVESKADGTADSETIGFTVQRASYVLEILSVDMQPEVNVGDSMAVDVVLKNRGRQFADDVFLTISIPALGIEERTYFGDLSPIDQDNPNKEDAVERRTYIRIPANVEPGLYDIRVEAYNSDSFDRVDRRILVAGGAVENTQVVTASTSKTFNTGETATYKLTLVNRGSVVRVFDLQVDSPDNLNVDLSDSVIVVPAGTSRTVEISANSAIRDEYAFTVDIMSDSGALIESKTFRANVVEGTGNGGTQIQANTTVLLTVILAIIFVVLLVVLIVLLTRKPETKEEYGESYY